MCSPILQDTFSRLKTLNLSLFSVLPGELPVKPEPEKKKKTVQKNFQRNKFDDLMTNLKKKKV